MKAMKAFLVCAFIFLSQIALAGPRVVRNGGDIYAIEFLGIGQQLLKTLAGYSHPGFDLKKLAQAVDEAVIESTSKVLTLNGAQKDAINSPTHKTILFNRISWAGRGDLKQKAIFVLHEYLGVAGISDKKYEISSQLIEKSGFGQINYQGQVFDRKLTKEEIKRVLPAYLNMIASQAKTLPSPADRDVIRQIWIAINNPTQTVSNGSALGQESYPIRSIIDWVSSRLDDLKAITEGERIESTSHVVEGFKNPARAIKCELGYSSIARMKDERIVKCEDDRSNLRETTDDEGYSDIRTIIISVDEKTLAPLGVLDVSVFQAG